MKEINEQNKDSILKGKKVVVVKFGHQFCPPCKIYDRILNSLPTDLELYSCDTMNNPDWIATLGMRSVPTTIVFYNGLEVTRMSGVQSEETVIELFKKYDR
jgi:thioredoxin-like negative regulator of GroEL